LKSTIEKEGKTFRAQFEPQAARRRRRENHQSVCTSSLPSSMVSGVMGFKSTGSASING
jgi:hypothetical protein